jgi:hypothetical protein
MAETELNKRQEAEALLPFLANNTLDGDDRVRVEAAVAADAELAVQLRALRRIRREVKAEEMEWSPGEMGLAKLLREIEIESPTEAPVEPEVTAEVPSVEPAAPAQPVPPTDSRPSRLTLRDAITGPASDTVTMPTDGPMTVPAPANTNSRVRLWQIAAAVAVAAFAAQSVFVWTGSSDRPDVQLASGDAMAPIGDGRLRIAFQPTAPEGDIRALLLSQNLVIIDGPSALGLYTVAVDEATVDDALAALLSKRALVETVSVGQ